MANTAPDPRDFTSWETAFDYPISAVRRFEQQLRTNIGENKEKPVSYTHLTLPTIYSV